MNHSDTNECIADVVCDIGGTDAIERRYVLHTIRATPIVWVVRQIE